MGEPELHPPAGALHQLALGARRPRSRFLQDLAGLAVQMALGG